MPIEKSAVYLLYKILNSKDNIPVKLKCDIFVNNRNFHLENRILSLIWVMQYFYLLIIEYLLAAFWYFGARPRISTYCHKCIIKQRSNLEILYLDSRV